MAKVKRINEICDLLKFLRKKEKVCNPARLLCVTCSSQNILLLGQPIVPDCSTSGG